jgi:uncharacterized protein
MQTRTLSFHSEDQPCSAVLRTPSVAPPSAGFPTVVLCAGMSLTKEVWLPAHAERLVAAGYATLNFDYRGFGASGGEPRRRLVPWQQVRDVQNALTLCEALDACDGARLALYGLSLGCSVALATAGIDDRVRCTIAVAGPSDLQRTWRRFPGYPKLLAKVTAARQLYVRDGTITHIAVDRLLADDPATAAKLRADVALHPGWSLDITYESLLDLFSFRPEAVVPDIRGPVLYVAPERDALIAQTELHSAWSKTRAPAELRVLEGAEHVDIYGTGAPYEALMGATVGWLDRWL